MLGSFFNNNMRLADAEIETLPLGLAENTNSPGLVGTYLQWGDMYSVRFSAYHWCRAY